MATRKSETTRVSRTCRAIDVQTQDLSRTQTADSNSHSQTTRPSALRKKSRARIPSLSQQSSQYEMLLTQIATIDRQQTPHATDHAIRSLRYFIGALVI